MLDAGAKVGQENILTECWILDVRILSSFFRKIRTIFCKKKIVLKNVYLYSFYALGRKQLNTINYPLMQNSNQKPCSVKVVINITWYLITWYFGLQCLITSLH